MGPLAVQCPLGSLLSLQIGVHGQQWVDDSTVVLSKYEDDHWIFTTVYSLEDNHHPVSGNRRFGVIDNRNGTYTFYTGGVDRISTYTRVIADFFLLGQPIFDGAERTWRSFQRGIESFVGEAATKHRPSIYRVNYEQVQRIFDGGKCVSSLGRCS